MAQQIITLQQEVNPKVGVSSQQSVFVLTDKIEPFLREGWQIKSFQSQIIESTYLIAHIGKQSVDKRFFQFVTVLIEKPD